MRTQLTVRARPGLARSPRTRFWRGWLLGWSGMVLAALLNGTFRALVTQPLFGETAARALATVLLLAVLACYQWWLSGRFPLPSIGAALRVGAAWTAMTLAFEVSFGRLVEHLSWAEVLADYDVTRGRIWVLVPVWLLVGPATVRALRSRVAGPWAS
jgi:hypothetical protein